MIEPRLFVVFRDGSGYELLSNKSVEKFREYLKNNKDNSQILEPKPLIPNQKNCPVSHKFIIQKFVNIPQREKLNIPSILNDTLSTKLNKYDNYD